MTPRTCLASALVAYSSLAAAGTGVPVVTAVDLGPGPARAIVKFRVAATAQVVDAAPADVTQLAGRTGVGLRQARRITPRLSVVELGVVAAPGSVSAAIARLREDPDVLYADLDRHRRPHLAPDDPGYPAGSSNGQWYLRFDPATPSATDAVSAWDVTTGGSGVIIAVLDTGVRYDHPDLGLAGDGGRLLPGYDFVGDSRISNDGDGWDLDPTDPGDWVTSSEVAKLPFSDCSAADSSWHGTRVSGIIGARTNNAIGVAGLNWTGWILPVRVLGKCGGYDSDIAAAMLWAGGIDVDGAPSNPYPARVINLSLGGGDTCPSTYQDAVAQLRSRGVLVVASAGNQGGTVETPANCTGVAAIAAVRHAGTKVGFSNLGPSISLSAPGGNCVNTGAGQPCLYSIDTTTNLGTQGPTANTYTDAYKYNVGTSFSAPIASGIAGLMLSVNGQLSTSQMTVRLREGATSPFPVSSDPTVPMCEDPAVAGTQGFECSCTTATCGAGLANAAGAVAAALRPVASVSVSGTIAAGQTVTLRGTGSRAACGRALTGYAWTLVSGTPPAPIGGAGSDTAAVVLPSSGGYTVRLTVTDDAGRVDSVDVAITSSTVNAPTTVYAGGSACPVRVVAVSVSPINAATRAGGTSVVFTASVANAADSSVQWYVDDQAGGNAAVGTISSAGVYTPPAMAPSGGRVIVKAVPVADPSRHATARVAVTSASVNPGGGSGGGGGGGALDVFSLALAAFATLAIRRRVRDSEGRA